MPGRKRSNVWFSFFLSQARQLRAKGPGLLLHKCRKAVDLLFSHLVAPAAVFFNADWPEAYYAVGKKYCRKHKDLSARYDKSASMLEQIACTEDKIILCMEKYTARQPDLDNFPDWVSAKSILFTTSVNRNRNVEGIHQETADCVRRLMDRSEFSKLGIEFVPGSFAMGSIGSVENIIIFIKASLLGLRPARKMVLLLNPGSPVNNLHYLRYWSRYVTVVSDPDVIRALTPLEKYLSGLIGFYMLVHGKGISSPFALGMIREQWCREKRSPLLTITDEDDRRGWRCLNEFGVPQGAWFVCLHAREEGWNDRGSLTNDFRNTDINTFMPAIERIKEAGGWVIRMGDPGMTRLDPMDRVIDYAHSDAKSDWMDVFLCSQCRFFIGTSSGVFTISMAFGVPVVVTNLLPAMGMYQLSSIDIFLPRICRSKTENRPLTFCELISPPFGRAFTQYHYDHMGIEVVENTPDEIKDAVVEMLGRLDGAGRYSEEDEHLQDRFKALAARCGALYGDPGIALHARIGRGFLKKHAALLPSDSDQKENSYMRV